MNKIVFYLKNIRVGGAQIMIEHLAAQYVKMGFSVSVIGVFLDKELYNELNKLGVDTVTIAKWNNDRLAKKIIMQECEKAYTVTMNWQDYCRIVMLKGNADDVVFFAVHYNDVISAVKNRFRIIENVNTLLLRNTIRRLIERQTIISIDEPGVKKTTEFYRFPQDLNDRFKIIRIPIDIDDDIPSENTRFEEGVFRIFSVARADFPFKGYLLGLIELMRKKLVPSDTVLDIVSYGKDQLVLEKKVNECEPDVKKRINLYGKVDYDGLKKYYSRSRLFVGMGTGLLDAAKYGTISIPIAPYTNELISAGFFHDDYRRLDTIDGSFDDFLECLKKVFGYNKEEYDHFSYLNREIIREYYSTDSVAVELLGLFRQEITNDDCVMTCKLSYLIGKTIRLVKTAFM